jgi:membrane protein implicated in regulation of membrane protease activity
VSYGSAPAEEPTGADVEGSHAPPAGEEIHLPGPTLVPIVTAAAITLIIIGTTISFVLSIIGAIVFILAVFRWVSHTSRDVASLPEDHRH